MTVRRAALDVFTNEPEIHPGLIIDYRVVSHLLVRTMAMDARLTIDPLTSLCRRSRTRLCKNHEYRSRPEHNGLLNHW